MPVCIVIVTYNSAEHLPSCLQSLSGVEARVVVVDNASSDDSVAVAQRHGVETIANPLNRGLAAAANQGAKACGSNSAFVLFLNPDTVLLAGWEEMERALLKDSRVGAVGGLLVDQRGLPQVGFTLRTLPSFVALAFEVLGLNRLWATNPVNRRYRCLDRPLDQPGAAEQPPGACLMVRRTALEAIEGWDEAFFPLWFEDVDLCLRLRQAGWTIRFEPAARWRHEGAHSLARISFAQKQIFWYRNLLYYVRKHFGSATALAMRLLICLGAAGRLVASLFAGGKEGASGAFWAIMKLALARTAGRPSAR